ncbi:MAG: 50S ribosomal protein L5 [bacterium]|nr:50S ribosomal protein L5 [bacterium]
MTKQPSQSQKDVRAFIEKIVVNVGVGKLSQNPQFADKGLPQVIRDIAAITGQKPRTRPAKISIAGFKVREGTTVGLQVTLRQAKMVDFFERLITIVLPRVHDFKGIANTAVDRGGTLNIGLKEQLIFPEIQAEDSPLTFPLGVNIVPRKKNRTEALAAYTRLGVPLKK